MKRTWLNFVIDGVTAAVALGIVWTGLLLYFVLPPGSGRQGTALAGMTRHEWGDWHLYLALTGLTLVVVHVVLHWPWVCVMVCRCLPGWSGGQPNRWRRTLAGILAVGVIAGVLGVSLCWARSAVQQSPSTPGSTHGGNDGGGHGYRGGRGAAPNTD